MTIAAWLRERSTLTGVAPALDPAPGDPIRFFERWLRHAAEAVAEPHAATLATIDRDGLPDARMLILKDVSERGFAFAGPRDSRKGSQLATHPAAALTFWWQPLVRSVRIRGSVVEASPEESAADLAQRSTAAREGIAPGEWVRWWLVPQRIEFWQGAADRRHTRIVYDRVDGAWLIGEGES